MVINQLKKSIDNISNTYFSKSYREGDLQLNSLKRNDSTWPQDLTDFLLTPQQILYHFSQSNFYYFMTDVQSAEIILVHPKCR